MEATFGQCPKERRFFSDVIPNSNSLGAGVFQRFWMKSMNKLMTLLLDNAGCRTYPTTSCLSNILRYSNKQVLVFFSISISGPCCLLCSAFHFHFQNSKHISCLPPAMWARGFVILSQTASAEVPAQNNRTNRGEGGLSAECALPILF